MEPKILFLGTGGDHHVVGKQLRASGGIIIQVDDYQFHIDPGPGALGMMQSYNVNPRETTALLVSHAHINHCNDVNAVLSAITLNGFDKKSVLICGKSLINGSEKIKPVIPPFYQNFVERIIAPDPSKRIGIENLEIQTLRTIHSDPHNLGFKLYTPEFILSYLSDTAYSPDLLKQYEKSDILILNVVYPFGTKTKINLNSYHAVKIINKIKPRLAIITHFGRKILAADPTQEAREIARQTMTQVISATDGMVIMPRSYSAFLRQKTLNLYSASDKTQDTISD
jgi:ribonuclease BN (tRNA processing enzyme)